MSDPYGHDDWTDGQRLEALRWAAAQDVWVTIDPSGGDDTAAIQVALDKADETGRLGIVLRAGRSVGGERLKR